MVSFADLGLSEKVLKAVQDVGYTEPTPIQEGAVPHALAGKDVLGIAQTGTGKTASFVLPMITRLERGRARARMPRTLILEPTRELAAQVDENFEKYGKYHKLNVALLIGGVSFADQERKLERGADVLIATPGRLLDHSERGKLLLTGVDILVIDEADRMLDMGFIPDIERIVSLIPFTRQTLFFSATMPPEIQRLADKFLQGPVTVETAKPSTTAKTVEQRLIRTGGKDYEKRATLRDALRSQENIKNAIVFCNRKRDVATVWKSLEKHGFSAGALHGDMDQRSRTNMLQGFKDNVIQILVASDVAARGLDIPDVSHVFNFDVPIHAEDYVHRIGRTGRAGRAGQAFTLVEKSSTKYLEAIEKLIDKQIEWMDLPDANVAQPAAEPEAKPARSKTRSKSASRSKKPASEAESADPQSELPASPESEGKDDRKSKIKAQNAERKSDSDNKKETKSSKKGKNDNKKPEQSTGFGDEVPAFMMIGR